MNIKATKGQNEKDKVKIKGYFQQKRDMKLTYSYAIVATGAFRFDHKQGTTRVSPQQTYGMILF